MPVRRILFALVAAALLSGAGYAAYWFHVAGEVRKGVESWAAARRAEGWRVDWREMATGGFPGRVRLRLAEPTVARPDGLSWTADRLEAGARPFDLTRIGLSAPGRHRLGWGERTAELNAAGLDGVLALGAGGRVGELSLTGAGLKIVEAETTMEADGLSLTILPLAVAVPSHDTETVRFAAAAHGITLPVLPGLVLERRVALAEVNGRVMGDIPAAPPVAALAAWAADGGTVEIDHLTLEWAPLALEADGTLALDPRGQPLAALSARVRGFPDLMDRLAAAGSMDAGAAAAAKLMLSLLAKPDRTGRPAVAVPVSVQDGALWLGPARVAQVPPLAWLENPD